MDIAKRNPQNPIMRPSDLKPGIEGMEIVCLLNPGVFRYNNKIWLLLLNTAIRGLSGVPII